jgi:hypothetical protein
MARQKKVLLVGATGFQQNKDDVRIDCSLWSNISEIGNIRDYDTVVVDLLELSDEARRKEVKWHDVHRHLNFHNAFEVLFNDGSIIVVGDPRFSVPSPAKDESKPSPPIPFLWWTGLTYTWDSVPGDTVHFSDDYQHRFYQRYISHLKRWAYSLASCAVDDSVVAQMFKLDRLKEMGIRFDITRDNFCYNRYRYALAFVIQFQQLKGRKHEAPEIVSSYGPLVILPTISIAPDEIRQLVLSDICGVETSVPEPKWIGEFAAPGQRQIDEEIQRIEADLLNVQNRLQEAIERKAKIRQCLKLLYERDFALEPVARDILRGLGAHVEDPSEPNKEDGWIVVRIGSSTHEGVLEIKSTRRDQLGEDGRKQLLEWIDRGRTLRRKKYKGIFIGSSAVDKPLKERPWAFSDSWSKAAELSEICAMKTEELYLIHLLHARGAVDLDKFWSQVFATDGIFDAKSYYELLTPKEAPQT